MVKRLLKLLIYRKEHPLAYRVLVYILLCSSFFTIIATIIQLYIDYRKDITLIQNRMEQIQKTYLQGISNSVWYFDDELIQTQLTGILQLQDIQYLEILGTDGSRLIAVGQPQSRNIISRQFALAFENEGHSVQIGTLHVTATIEGVYHRLRERIFIILGTQGIKTFVVSICILVIFQYLITRHLTNMAQYVEHLDLNHLESPLHLHRSTSKENARDELERVAHAINEMRVNLIQDIAERKRVEQEREELIKELETKNTELEQFTYTVSHDLKSPLITIKGFLGLLEGDALSGDTRQLQSDIRYISNAADKMHQLLDDLLELSRIGRITNPAEKIQLHELVSETLELLAGQLAQKHVKIDTALEFSTVYGDRIRLREVFENLINNAIKFSGDQPESHIQIGIREDGEQQVIYIRDNGIGIHPRYHENIFGLFEKLDADMEGTGIGLAIVKRIIEFHQGQIWVESQGAGKGATFCFTLPKHEEQS